MIEAVQYIADEQDFITYNRNGKNERITYSDIQKIWPEVDSETIEGGRAKWSDDILAFTAMVASGQGGVLFIWDACIHSFVHFSETSYCVDFLISNKDVFTLCEVQNYVTPYHLEVYVTAFGTRDISKSGQRVYCNNPQSYEGAQRLQLMQDENKLFISTENKDFLYSNDIEHIRHQKPNEDFMALYKKWENAMDPGKLVMRGMIT